MIPPSRRLRLGPPTTSCANLLALSLLAGCAPPQFASGPADPSVGYRFDDRSGFTEVAPNVLAAELHGTTVKAEVQGREARLVVTIDNPTKAIRTLRLGPQNDATNDQALGELRRQHLDGRPLEGGSAYVPFLPMQDIEVRPGTRVVLYVNTPSGKEPEVGEYLVLLLEVGAAGKRAERRLIPLVAAYTPPRRRR